MSALFSFPVRVYYEDTDFSQNVYHAAYVKFFERGRTEFLRARGIHHGEMYAGAFGERLAFAVAKMDIDFLRPAHIDDLVQVSTEVAHVSGARIVLDQKISLEGVVLVQAKVIIAVINEAGRPRRLPVQMRALID